MDDNIEIENAGFTVEWVPHPDFAPVSGARGWVAMYESDDDDPVPYVAEVVGFVRMVPESIRERLIEANRVTGEMKSFMRSTTPEHAGIDPVRWAAAIVHKGNVIPAEQLPGMRFLTVVGPQEWKSMARLASVGAPSWVA